MRLRRRLGEGSCGAPGGEFSDIIRGLGEGSCGAPGGEFTSSFLATKTNKLDSWNNSFVFVGRLVELVGADGGELLGGEENCFEIDLCREEENRSDGGFFSVYERAGPCTVPVIGSEM